MTEAQLRESSILRDKVFNAIDGSPLPMALLALAKTIIDVISINISKETHDDIRKLLVKLCQHMVMDFDFNYSSNKLNIN